MPEALQLKKISGRVGRMSFSTHAMNNGVSAETTSLASKHKDPKTMLGYVVPDEGLLMQAALGIGIAVKNTSTSSSRLAGISFAPEESDDEDSDDGKQPVVQPLHEAIREESTMHHHLHQSTTSSSAEPPSTVPLQQSAARKKARLIIPTARAETDVGVNKTNILNFYF